MPKKHIAIFVSGNGSNCENIIKHFSNNTDVEISLVVSNKPDAFALVRAQRLGIETCTLNKQQFNDEAELMTLLKKHNIDFIVLAGFLLMIPPFLVEAFNRRMINIHPALLPKYGGKGMYGHHVHEAVWAAKEKETGFTVHWVSNVCDGGDIIMQHRVALTDSDTPDTIAEKEHELEMKYFPTDIENILNGFS